MTTTNPCNEDYQNTVASEQNTSNEVINSGHVDIQSQKAKRCKRWIQVTNSTLSIYNENKSKLLETIEIKKLMNIDALQNNRFQLLFNDQQHSIMYIYCDKTNTKNAWVDIFEQLCPMYLLTKELQCVKNCASNLGYNKEQIDNALTKYHQKYGTMYNVHEFIGIILDQQSKHDEKEEKDVESLQCGVCHQIYVQPVRNIHNKTYCFNCIKTWFDMIKEDQKQIRDPLTNKPLPKHCRLLIPDFVLTAQTWNHTHKKSNQQFSKDTIEQLKDVTESLNENRKNILEYLNNSDESDNAQEIINAVMKAKDFKFSKSDIENLLDKSMKCYEYFQEIQYLIADGTIMYNNHIENVLGKDKIQEKDKFKWMEPVWKNNIDKNCVNYCEEYQVDEILMSQCQATMHKMMDGINELLQNEMQSAKEVKEKICEIMLSMQDNSNEEKVVVDDADHEVKENKLDIENKGRYMHFERIMYAEKNGKVNTRCIREIADCVNKNKAFELYHNDLQSKSMTKYQLIRFLETAGMNGADNQYHIYSNFAIHMKHKILKLSEYLKKVDNNKFSYVPYWKYVSSVDVIKQPVNSKKDRVELKIRLSSPTLNYNDELGKYGGNKRKLGKQIKKQLIKHLGLKCDENHVVVENIKEGSVVVVIVIAGLVAVVGGMVYFAYRADQDGVDFQSAIRNAAEQVVGAAVNMAVNMANIIGSGLSAIWSGVVGVAGAVIAVGQNVVRGIAGFFRGNNNNNNAGGPQAPNVPLINANNDNGHGGADNDDGADSDNGNGNDNVVGGANVPLLINVDNDNDNDVPQPPQNNNDAHEDEIKRDDDEKVDAVQSEDDNNNANDLYMQIRYSLNIGNIQNRAVKRNNQWYAVLDCGCEKEFDPNNNLAGREFYRCDEHDRETCLPDIARCLLGDRFQAIHRVLFSPHPEHEFAI